MKSVREPAPMAARAARAQRAMTVVLLACTVAAAIPVTVTAQGTAADYARAEGLARRLDGLVVDDADPPIWLKNGDSFIYNKSVRGGHTFVLVDAATLARRSPFDQSRLAATLSSDLKRPITALKALRNGPIELGATSGKIAPPLASAPAEVSTAADAL